MMFSFLGSRLSLAGTIDHFPAIIVDIQDHTVPVCEA